MAQTENRTALVVSELGDVRRFRSQKKVCAYAGLVPGQRESAGRVADFHALRDAFSTNLARAGVHPKQALDLARHSDINLTMSRYGHTLTGERAAAWPDLRRRPDQERMRATGTDGEGPR